MVSEKKNFFRLLLLWSLVHQIVSIIICDLSIRFYAYRLFVRSNIHKRKMFCVIQTHVSLLYKHSTPTSSLSSSLVSFEIAHFILPLSSMKKIEVSERRYLTFYIITPNSTFAVCQTKRFSPFQEKKTSARTVYIASNCLNSRKLKKE